jgi:uncharacterized protein YegJ (DUF2314 family)
MGEERAKRAPRWAVWAALLVAGCVTLSACWSRPDDEAALQRALGEARRDAQRSLPDFWEHWASPSETEFDFRLRVRLAPIPGARERVDVWVEEIERGSGSELSAALAQTLPELAPLKRGDRLSFDETMIADWAFFREEELLGHYTTRVLLPRLPTDQAEALRSVLSEHPLGDKEAPPAPGE